MTKAARLLAALLLLAAAALAPFASGEARAAPQRARIAVTSQWLREVASFICGDRLAVRALTAMDENGVERTVARPSRNDTVIAFDAADAARRRISANNKNLRLLFDKVQVSEDRMRLAFFDPATLPFVAQEVMKTVSQLDPDSYAYYQRRLAEFQSRIDSMIDVGHRMNAGGKRGALDLTGAEGVWLRSALPGIVRPPEGVWESWLSGGEGELRAALDEAARRGWLLLLDPWTPDAIRGAAVAYENRLTLPPPPADGDVFVFLNDILTAAAERLAAPASGKK